MNLKNNAHKFQKISYSGIIPFVPVYTDNITNQRKVPKWLPFENYTSESLNI